MASRSSRPKNASRVTHEHAAALLEDGARIEAPADDLSADAEQLRDAGLIDFSIREYVNCVEPRDRDFPPRNRHCKGRILLQDGQDEDGDEIRCPKCERPVRPYSLGKLRHDLLQVSVRQAGVNAWVRAQLEAISNGVRDLGDGVFRADGFGDLGVIVCIVDADGPADARFNTQSYAATNPVCYITIHPRPPEGRFLTGDWVCRVGLVDLITGRAALQKTLTNLAAAPPPASVSKADVPVYAKGHVLIQPEEKPHPERVFFVELDEKVVRVNGEVVINPQAGPRHSLFRILWQQFLKDLASGLAPDQFHPLSMTRLLALMKEAGHEYTDETTLRKLINNLQTDIETAVKRKIGVPISREDIVQTCRMTGQADTSGGYRINPFSVAIRPPQAS